MRKISRSRQRWIARNEKIKRHRQLRSARSCRIVGRTTPDVLIAPAYFNIAPYDAAENNEACTQFLDFLRRIRTFRGQHLRIDMSRASRLVVTATLLFKAEVAYLIERGVRVSALPPKKERSHQVLTQTGLTTLLGIAPCKRVDREDTVHWKHASGAWSRAQPQKLASLLISGESFTGSLLYTGMIESVANSIEHAYQDHPNRRTFADGQDGWWGFQQYRDGVLSTCICDLGIGISSALPIKLSKEPSLYHALLALFRKKKGRDIQSILAAVEYGRTGTNEAPRGKGLRDAHRVIDDAGEGSLHIISNRGLYAYQRGAGKEKPVVVTKRLTNSISGTIYYWSFPIQLQEQAGAEPALGEIQ